MVAVEAVASWARRTDDLVRHASDFLVNRWDAFGINEGGKWRTARGSTLDEAMLRRHFAGEVVVGLHAVSEDGRCRWIGFDIDAKDPVAAAEAPEMASRLGRVLDRCGAPYADEDSDGRGGRHLWVIFETPVQVSDARCFAHLIAEEAGYGGEVFPKGEPSTATPYGGGFLRLPGRHPTRDHASRVRSGEVWQEGNQAVEAWLGTPLVPENHLRSILREVVPARDSSSVPSPHRTEENGREQKDDRTTTDESRREQTEGGRRAEDDRQRADGEQTTTERLQKSSVRLSGLQQAERDQIESAIARSLPRAVGTRQQAIFNLARRLRGIPCLHGAEPLGLRPIVEEWHRRAFPSIGTKPFEDTWVDFLRGYPKVRVAVSDRALEIASGLDDLPEPPICEQYESSHCRRLIKLVVALAGKHADADGVFFLSCRSAAEAIGIGVTQAANYLFLLCQEAVLVRVDRQRGPREAFRYRLGPRLTTCAGDKQ